MSTVKPGAALFARRPTKLPPLDDAAAKRRKKTVDLSCFSFCGPNVVCRWSGLVAHRQESNPRLFGGPAPAPTGPRSLKIVPRLGADGGPGRLWPPAALQSARGPLGDPSRVPRAAPAAASKICLESCAKTRLADTPCTLWARACSRRWPDGVLPAELPFQGRRISSTVPRSTLGAPAWKGRAVRMREESSSRACRKPLQAAAILAGLLR